MIKLLCYELNEVPWRVVDHYVSKRQNSNLAQLLERSAQYTTKTVDSGELHPWSTWPTVHRGVSNEVHNIRWLNQDLEPSKTYPPAWELLTKNGKSCGVFGSLQSFPPSEHENMRFHVPDTFAAGSQTIPQRCQAFQAFNLMQTGENTAVAGKLGIGQFKMALGMLRSGIKPATYMKVALQLFREFRNPLFKSRRALLQPELAFDVFLSCLKDEQPEYVTFFSNHVAGVMHRYWKYTFPEDFNYKLSDSNPDQFHYETLMIAMDIFDAHLGKLFEITDRYGYELLVMSSMGQEAIDRGEYIPELKLTSLDQFLKRLDIRYSVKQNLAMHPDLAFEFDSPKEVDNFQSVLLALTDTVSEPLFSQKYKPVGNTINLSIRSTSDLVKAKTVLLQGEQIKLEELGLTIIERDIGTGYHQPHGILIWENFRTLDKSRSTIDSRSILPTLLSEFEVEPRDYMRPDFTKTKEKVAAITT